MWGISDKIAILGMSGSGKTFLSRKIQALYPRKIIIDVLDEYSDGDQITVKTFEAFAEELKNTENCKNFKIVVKLDFASEGVEEISNEIIRLAYVRGSVLLVLEEVQYHASVHYMPSALKRAILTGRHRNLAMIFTSQRPGEVHKTVISQCSKIYLGKMFEHNDLQYISKIIGKDADKLAEYPFREFLEITPGIRQRVIKNDLTEKKEPSSVKVIDQNSETESESQP